MQNDAETIFLPQTSYAGCHAALVKMEGHLRASVHEAAHNAKS